MGDVHMQEHSDLTQGSWGDLISLKKIFFFFPSLLKDFSLLPQVSYRTETHIIPDGNLLPEERDPFTLTCWGGSCFPQGQEKPKTTTTRSYQFSS